MDVQGYGNNLGVGNRKLYANREIKGILINNILINNIYCIQHYRQFLTNPTKSYTSIITLKQYLPNSLTITNKYPNINININKYLIPNLYNNNNPNNPIITLPNLLSNPAINNNNNKNNFV